MSATMTDKQVRKSSTVYNYGVNIAGALIPLAIALITVPIYISHIGPARYGLLAIVWILLGYFGFLDLGLSRASANALARMAPDRTRERMRVLFTALCINSAMGVLGSLALGAFGYVLLEHLLKVPPSIQPEIAAAFPWVALLLPLAMAGGVAIGCLESRERFLEANVLQQFANIGGQIPPVLAAVYYSPSLSVVIPVAVTMRAVAVATTLAYVFWIERSGELPSFDRRTAKSLLSYGGWVSVSSLVNPLLSTLDQLVVGSVLNVTQVAFYAVPMNLVTRSQIVPVALARTLFPSMSRAESEYGKEIAGRAASTLAYGYGLICAPAIFILPTFLALWVGTDFARSAAPVAQILMLGAWINGLAMIPFNLIQAQGRPHLTATFHAAEALPFIAVLLLLTHQFGLVGAAVAWTLRVTLDATLLYFAARLPANAMRQVLPSVAIMLMSFAGAMLSPGGAAIMILSAVLSFALMAAVAYRADPAARAAVQRIISITSNRLRGQHVAS